MQVKINQLKDELIENVLKNKMLKKENDRLKQLVMSYQKSANNDSQTDKVGIM